LFCLRDGRRFTVSARHWTAHTDQAPRAHNWGEPASGTRPGRTILSRAGGVPRDNFEPNRMQIALPVHVSSHPGNTGASYEVAP